MDFVFGAPPKPEIADGQEMDYFRRLREWLQVVHDYTRQAQANVGVRQERAYNTKCQERAFVPGDRSGYIALSAVRVSPRSSAVTGKGLQKS